MSAARDRGAGAIMAAPGSADFDDMGAVLVAMRHMLDGAGTILADDSRHLYVLATMAEAAWKWLDVAMQAGAK